MTVEIFFGCLALAIGSVITGVILSLLKKPVTEEDESFEDLGTETGAASDDGEIKIKTSCKIRNGDKPI